MPDPWISGLLWPCRPFDLGRHILGKYGLCKGFSHENRGRKRSCGVSVPGDDGGMTDPMQSSLRFAPWADPRTRRLPGTIPVTIDEWLTIDDAYAGQMALRDRLLATHPDAVVAMDADARPAAQELLAMVLAALPHADGHTVHRADGVTITADPADPMASLCRMVAEDLCIMERRAGGDEHLLTAAALCFPAGWTLAQKFMRPMVAIHAPVARYDTDIAQRVQRLLDGIRPGIGMMRGTAHWSGSPLHNPLSEDQKAAPPAETPHIRVERQCLFRLPQTGAVVFSIHTSIVDPAALTSDQAAALTEFPIRRSA